MHAKLWTHPAYEGVAIDAIDVSLERLSATTLRLRYLLSGRIDDIVLPQPAPPLRANNLWRTTCLEAFLAPRDGPGYRELNFSPSSQWAAYDFSAYRAGMVQAPLHTPPEIEMARQPGRLEIVASLSIELAHEPYRLGLCAVIEEMNGRLSYWALNHPGGAVPPDFHHPACFAADLPPAPAP